MNLGKVDILDVVCAVIVADLTTGPVNTFDLDYFAVLDSASEGNCGMLDQRPLERNARCTVWVPSVLSN